MSDASVSFFFSFLLLFLSLLTVPFVEGPPPPLLQVGSRRVLGPNDGVVWAICRFFFVFFFFVNYTTDIFRIDLHLRMEMTGQEWVEGGDDENGRW